MLDKDPCWSRRTAGAVIMVAAFIVLMGIITGEALYPGYHTGEMDISDLAWKEPSATIFNAAMIVGGVMYSLTAILLRHAGLPRSVTVPAFLMGVGGAGVGIFPLYTGAPHVIAALLTFGAGAITALMAGRTADAPFKYISLFLGTISLVSLAIFAISVSSPSKRTPARSYPTASSMSVTVTETVLVAGKVVAEHGIADGRYRDIQDPRHVEGLVRKTHKALQPSELQRPLSDYEAVVGGERW